jgi:putative OPT family oligopeptide transporter
MVARGVSERAAPEAAAHEAAAHEPAVHERAVHEPFVPANANVRELTLRAVVIGAALGVIFAASSVYLALKVGLTVSASIPIAVLSITMFRAFGRATILENNIVQTTGSAGESLAAGIAFTLPALLLMGYELEPLQVLLCALLGGVLGVLMMIPLREGLIVKEHGKLPYPEGTACAEVLVVGEQGGTDARTVFGGFGLGVLYKLCASGLRLWNEQPERVFSWYKGASVGAEISPELLGVGYIIGPRISATMLAGGVLGYLVIMPAIALFGGQLDTPLYPAAELLVRNMSPQDMRSTYVLYIGAGAVATGGIVSLVRALPTIASAFAGGMRTFQSARVARQGASAGSTAPDVPRTSRDLPISFVVGGSLLLVLAIWLAPPLGINFASALLVVLFGFLFTTVSSRITGEIGSSSNPISGMTVATLLITCLLFLLAGWTGSGYRAMALVTGAIVCVAASNGGTTSQDLKTGFLVGATPRHQQIGLLVGVVTSALVIGFTVNMLNDAYTTIVPRSYGPAQVSVVTDKLQTAPDKQQYRVGFQRESGAAIPQGRYLVDAAGHPQFLVDPGIGGVVRELDGKKLTKLDAPKAQLFALIIDGILTQKLPWALVLIGVFISLMMELCGVASLPFAVGLYLPISTSTPIMFGGLVRYFSDRRKQTRALDSEASPGTLLASGYIAGGAIAGLLLAGVAAGGIADTVDVSRALGWLGHPSPGEAAAASDLRDVWAMFWFAALAFTLYAVGTKVNSPRSPSLPRPLP